MFPWWERLHGFWRTLPNFNPFTVTSQPGQDMAMEAVEMLTGIPKSNSTEENDETPPDAGMSIRDEPSLIGHHTQSKRFGKAYPHSALIYPPY